MKKLFRFISISTLSFIAIPSMAMNCDDIVKQIYDLSMGNPDSKQPPQWQDLAWIKKTLGHETEFKNSITYTWPEFIYIIETDKDGKTPTIKTLGDSSPILTALHKSSNSDFTPTLDQAKQALGQPASVAPEKIYNWSCPPANKQDKRVMSIKVVTDTTDKITEFDGYYCVTGKCGEDNSFSLDASDIETILKSTQKM